ncbi:MAG: sodium:solute symporter [Thiohalorhabdaceae bacterium]
MVAVAPRAVTAGAFYGGRDRAGRAVSPWALTGSIFISWIFAKSVTNAANLGASHGVLGGLAYAAYWLAIPVAGWVIFRLRTREGATGLVPFLVTRYGRAAAAGFALAILIRLYNEVWSNTAVVGAYFGAPGSPAYIAAALAFTAITLAYSLKGGLRGAILTDGIQAVLFALLLGWVLFLVVPGHGPAALATADGFGLAGGADLLLVALLQVLSYPFHDPVLTDRGFLTDERTMLRAFVVAGLLGFVAILVFSLVGVHARLSGLEASANTPKAVAATLGGGALFLVTAIMITSAGSTLDSALAALTRLGAQDLPGLARRPGTRPSLHTGMILMTLFALAGNLPMLVGTEILKATTVSGTMMMGLAPVFLLHRLTDYAPAAFHLSFWPGVAVGVALAGGWLPDALAIGDGVGREAALDRPDAALLGANVYGLALCTLGYLAPLALAGRRSAEAPS